MNLLFAFKVIVWTFSLCNLRDSSCAEFWLVTFFWNVTGVAANPRGEELMNGAWVAFEY